MTAGARALDVANRHPRLRLSKRAVAAAIRVLDSSAEAFRGGCPRGELSIAFLTDEALAGLHGRYLGDTSETDVITFEGDPAHGMAGEICVSADAARRQRSGSPGKVSEEIALYMVHGWLHLAGYDDRRPAAKRLMRAAEARAMRLLARSRAMPRFKLA